VPDVGFYLNTDGYISLICHGIKILKVRLNIKTSDALLRNNLHEEFLHRPNYCLHIRPYGKGLIILGKSLNLFLP